MLFSSSGHRKPEFYENAHLALHSQTDGFPLRGWGTPAFTPLGVGPESKGSSHRTRVSPTPTAPTLRGAEGAAWEQPARGLGRISSTSGRCRAASASTGHRRLPRSVTFRTPRCLISILCSRKGVPAPLETPAGGRLGAGAAAWPLRAGSAGLAGCFLLVTLWPGRG